MKKKVYTALTADILHKGHFNILNKVLTNVQINIHKNNVRVKFTQVFVFIILFKI